MKGTESSLCIVTMCLRERKEEREREMGVRDALSFKMLSAQFIINSLLVSDTYLRFLASSLVCSFIHSFRSFQPLCVWFWGSKKKSTQSLPLSMSAAAAAAKSFESCLTLCDPIDSSPSGSPVTGILQARTLEWVAISFSNA